MPVAGRLELDDLYVLSNPNHSITFHLGSKTNVILFILTDVQLRAWCSEKRERRQRNKAQCPRKHLVTLHF